MNLDTIVCADALEFMRTLSDASVNCVVTSPPYYGLRDYGVSGQLGLEASPRAYVDAMCAVFSEVRRVLRDDGTLWLNIGDSYWNSTFIRDSSAGAFKNKGDEGYGEYYAVNGGGVSGGKRRSTKHETLKEKDLIGIPWRLAFALQDDAWYLRSDIIWSKPNPMPESVTDRPTKAHEYVFLMSKSGRYWYDQEAIKEPSSPLSIARVNGSTFAKQTGGEKDYGKTGINPNRSMRKTLENFAQHPETRNSRSVWTIATEPTPFAHFATMPQTLVERCILAGCPKGGVVLDPFVGSGTTALVARRLDRHYIGCDLNPEYVALAEKRLRDTDPYQHHELPNGTVQQSLWGLTP